MRRLKDWRGGYGWGQVANGGFGRGAPSRPYYQPHSPTTAQLYDQDIAIDHP